ncbi:MAG: TM2 domain-containing protein [Bacillota bacterium]|nr:TM2 domain-containing protein [Bacillota bacterium]
MNVDNLNALVGEHHAEEVRELVSQDEFLLKKAHLRNPKVTLVLAIFLGMFGIDRLYQSGVKVFLCKIAILLLTLGTWWLADIGYSISTTQEVNYNRIKNAAAQRSGNSFS